MITQKAESCDRLSVFEKSPQLFSNLRDLFVVSVRVLQALRREQVSDIVMERLAEIYEYQPAFLDFDIYTDSMMEFYMRADITHSDADRARTIGGIDALSDKQNFQILRFLQKHHDEGHYYCDYLIACAQIGDYMYGLTPNISIREAHDRVIDRIRNSHDTDTRIAFEVYVNSKEYLKLTTICSDKDEEIHEEDRYLVIAPETTDELFVESKNMHNCVRIYTPKVAQRATRIYFLRKKEEPFECYGTMEVSGDGRALIQAKAFANRKLPKHAQTFVIKWCRHKGIRINTYDINIDTLYKNILS